MDILITSIVPDSFVNSLREKGHNVDVVAEDRYAGSAGSAGNNDLKRDIGNYHVVVNMGQEVISPEVMDAAVAGLKKLNAVVFFGTDAARSIDLEAAKKRNIQVLNTPGANANAVAEYTFALMLEVFRKGREVSQAMQQHKWAYIVGEELQGKTLGLIGAGAIAQKVARIAEGFGMNVVYWTRSGEKPEMRGKFCSFEDVLRTSDVVSLHVPRSSGEIISHKEFGQMKSTAPLINMGPPSLVNIDALSETLDAGRNVVFDGFYVESAEAWDDPILAKLLEARTFKVFPHIAWATKETTERTFRRVVRHIDDLARKMAVNHN